MLPFTETLDAPLRDNCRHAKQVNEDALRQILTDNAQTEFGRAHAFSSIRSVADYRDHVPLAGYDAFADAIQRMRDGEQNVLTVYPIVSYCQTSGTTGSSKFIPLSQTALDRYSDYFERYRNRLLHKMGGRRFLINCFRTDLTQKISDTSLFSEIYFRFLYESGMMRMEEFIGGRDMIFVKGEEDMLYAKLWEALADTEFVLLESQFLYEMLNFFSYLEENWRDILTAMRERYIPPNISLSVKIRSYLLTIPVSSERLDTIAQECEQGFEGIAQRLWHRLALVSGVSNRSYQTETAALDRYLGAIPRYYLCYCASECYIGTPVAVDDYGYVLLPQNAFFEFLPYPSDGDETLLPHELTVGAMYEPVITNFSGLYRYRLGDVVKIVDYVDESPVMEFQFRRSQALNIAGEKYDMRQLESAVFSLREKGIFVENYCFGACLDTIPGKYLAVMTLMKQRGAAVFTEEQLSLLLDEALAAHNHDYADLRSLKELDAPRAILLDNTMYAQFSQQYGLNRKHGHNKPKHIFRGEVSEKQWEQIQRKAR